MMTNLIRGNFKNHFNDTAGISEYFKFLFGEGVNEERLLITSTDVYLVGEQTDRKIGMGSGGREYIFWMKDGNVFRLKDIWHLRETRPSETPNVIQMQNVYKPKEGLIVGSALYGTRVEKDDLAVFNILPEIRKLISNKLVKISSSQESVERIKQVYESHTDDFMKIYLDKLSGNIGSSSRNYTLFISEATDRIKSDMQILRLLYAGSSHLKNYEPLILTSGWQHSLDPYEEMLTELKEYYFKSVSLGVEESFSSLVLRLRSRLLPNNSQVSMNIF